MGGYAGVGRNILGVLLESYRQPAYSTCMCFTLGIQWSQNSPLTQRVARELQKGKIRGSKEATDSGAIELGEVSESA